MKTPTPIDEATATEAALRPHLDSLAQRIDALETVLDADDDPEVAP